MDLGTIGCTRIERAQGSLDPQGREHAQQFRRNGRVDP
jgi:hypothetical protein